MKQYSQEAIYLATMIRCGTCGKRYDYNKDELCPRCGAYTSPSDRQQQMIQVERQLLSERVRSREADCTPQCMPDGYGGHEDRRRQHPASASSPTAQSATRTTMRREAAQPRYDARREYAQERQGKTLGKIKAAVLLAAAAVALLFVLPAAAGPALEEQALLFGRVEDFPVHSHSLGETFQTGDFSITASEWGFVEDPVLELRLPEGKRMLYVQVSFPGVDDPGDVLPEVYLSSGGVYYPCLTGSGYWQLSSIARDAGYEEVSLMDAGYYDPVDGYFLFVVDGASAPFTLCVEELQHSLLGWTRVAGVHEIALGTGSGMGVSL